MGGTSSQPNIIQPGDLRLLIENPEVTPGDEIIGTVGLQVREVIGVDTLHIEFIGEIESEFTETSTDGDGTTNERNYREHMYIINYKCPLYVWPDRAVQPGQYSLPFQLKVPLGLPSSLNWAQGSTKARVNYKVTCWLIPGIQDTINIGVQQRENLLNQSLKLFRSAAMRYCCFSKGSISYSLELNKGSFFTGEDVVLSINLDCSQAKTRPPFLRGYLHYRILLTAQGHRKYIGGKVDTNRVAVDRVANVQTLTLVLKLQPDRVNTLSSLNTGLIKSDFFVFIEPVNPSSCLSYDQFNFEMPLVVNSKLQFQPPPIPPPNWSPNLLMRSTIDFGERDISPRPSAPPAP
mmetsp:Transcript_21639/g.39555  ORF Transcript_21639/g.39555 Transcript_21639/m.39555 type:complete len:348 (-) Transcript_21639:57-1100(-)